MGNHYLIPPAGSSRRGRNVSGDVEDDEDALYREMERRAEMEDEYGGGAGDWDH